MLIYYNVITYVYHIFKHIFHISVILLLYITKLLLRIIMLLYIIKLN